MRIHAKRLRYALDLLGPSLPRREAADYIEALAALQDTLGELNDASVALTRLTAAVEEEGAARAVEEWFNAVEPALVSRAAQQLSALRRRPRPWPLG